MRRAKSLLVIAAFAFGVGGCLSTIIPEHHPSTTQDAAVAAADDGGDMPASLPADGGAGLGDGGP